MSREKRKIELTLSGRVAFALVYFCLMIPQAGATPPSINLRFTDSLIADARDDNQNGVDDDDNYELIINRLSLNGQLYGISLDARLDTMYFHEPPTDEFKTTWARPERLSLSKRWDFSGSDQFTVTLGDQYQQLGHGQILALRKVDELGVDISLRGAKLALRSGAWNTQVFGGVSNVVNIDMVSMHHVEDKNDLIIGGQSSLRFTTGGEAGFLYAYIQPEEMTIEGADPPDATSSGGFFFNLPSPTEFLSLYAEVDAQQRRVIERVQEGYAGYLTLDWHFGDTTLITEGLWVENFQQRGSNNTALISRFNYNQGPTLERIDQEVAETYDVRGTRARVQQEFLEGELTVYLNGLYRLTKPNDPMEITQYHGFGGLDWYFDEGRSRLSASGGHRLDFQQGYINRVWSHAEGDYVQHIWGSIAGHLTTQFQRIQVEQQPFFLRGSTVAGLEKAGLGSLSVEWGVDTQNRSAGVRQVFWAGLLNWDISRIFLLRATVGSQRGGIKCVGGVCRDFPEFSGYRLQLIARHDLAF